MRCLPPQFLAALAIAVASSCDRAPDTLVRDSYDQAAMDIAIATARASADNFLAVFESGDAEDYGVKAPISDGENTEHFWLSDITYADGAFEGTIGNEPGVVGNVKYGQRWTVKKEKISDWLYVKDGKMHGNWTLRVLLDTMPAEEAALWRSRLAE